MAPVHHPPGRFIPTCVGSIPPLPPPSGAPPVHPHLRGEHARQGQPHIHALGSSPPAWGACESGSSWNCPGRFIPTCVGSITMSLDRLAHCPVHPHLRGEHVAPGGVAQHIDGSSPPAWGALHPLRAVDTECRFIPTCVGSISTTAAAARLWSVHPHLRGEHEPSKPYDHTICGSSPPAWGA